MQPVGDLVLPCNTFRMLVFHGLEELISNDLHWVEIPPLYAKLHRLDT